VKACRWVFISLHRKQFGVQRLCQTLGVHRLAFYKWLAGADARARRAADDAAVVALIRAEHAASVSGLRTSVTDQARDLGDTSG
jgi:hypothetical protein